MKIAVNKATTSVNIKVDADFSAEQLQQLIADLANARAQIAENTDRPKGPQGVVVGPNFWAQWDILQSPYFNLSFSHPGLNWLNFALPTTTAQEIKIYLEKYLAAVAAASTTPGSTTFEGGSIH